MRTDRSYAWSVKTVRQRDGSPASGALTISPDDCVIQAYITLGAWLKDHVAYLSLSVLGPLQVLLDGGDRLDGELLHQDVA